MRFCIMLTISFLLFSCATSNNDIEAITINEDQLIQSTGSHPEKVDALYFRLKELKKVNIDLLEKLIHVKKIMYEKKVNIDDQQRGIIVAGSGRKNSTYLIIMLTTTDGTPLAYKEYKKKGTHSAIYEVTDDNNLEITWYTSSGNDLKKHSFDKFKITSDTIK